MWYIDRRTGEVTLVRPTHVAVESQKGAAHLIGREAEKELKELDKQH